MDKRTFHCRRTRRAAILAGLILFGWFELWKDWEPIKRVGSRSFTLARKTPWSKVPTQWVGGGGSVPLPSLMVQDEAHTVSQPLQQPKFFDDDLPDVIRIPFEEAVKDVELEGWEDEWFSTGNYNKGQFGQLAEPKLDFVYNWVNGSDEAFRRSLHTYEQQSPLNDAQGVWLSRHGMNRYRDWDELRFSLRSLNSYAKKFINKIQLLVNSVEDYESASGIVDTLPQRPDWLRDNDETNGIVQILGQESFFGEKEKACLPTFNSLSIESQIYMTPSTTDHMVALSDDMFLGMEHAASDFYSPLFGPVMAFKTDHYNAKSLSKGSMPSFGEKPFAYYTSYLLNHRFGERNRHVQAHFAHSVSRAVMREAMASFPRPSMHGACQRFRGEDKYQIYPWFASFHYSIERFREALLWSFVALRSDADADDYLDYAERSRLLAAIEVGQRQFAGRDAPSASSPAETGAEAEAEAAVAAAAETTTTTTTTRTRTTRTTTTIAPTGLRDRMYLKVAQMLRGAGLQPPKVNVNVLWTAIDGPQTIHKVKCDGFHVDKCLGDSFASPLSDDGAGSRNPDFAVSNVFARLAHEHPACGDCLLKFALAAVPRGLEPLLPPADARPADRDVIVRALKKYQHTVVDTDTMKFFMVKDSEQARAELLERTIERGAAFGQWCFNDDVMTESAEEVDKVRGIMRRVFETLWPERTAWERTEL
ncbi:putative udp-glucose 4-epimerase protein [Rosellinia necatrix]|uniref:Putative udp-glucose 4-epimerase protein n=1 Tax=Rosellinia necatrix TaxID=77044 RepID=A0A1W2TV91_ROSNE|nr:putative udp-glucose 4-epimerase protein [Rosellinia necatrix]